MNVPSDGLKKAKGKTEQDIEYLSSLLCLCGKVPLYNIRRVDNNQLRNSQKHTCSKPTYRQQTIFIRIDRIDDRCTLFLVALQDRTFVLLWGGSGSEGRAVAEQDACCRQDVCC